MSEKILVTGANGQIGKVLTAALREKYGRKNVIASDIVKTPADNEPYLFLDILNKTRLYEIVEDHNITQVFHLAAILSANGEWNPLKTWNINLNGLITILELAKEKKLKKVFFPSTIAVFGRTTPRVDTPQAVPLEPETIYGISKVSGELLCNYYHQKYGIDVRSIRYPGIIGYQSIPHGGTTDYAVEIFHSALKGETYECFLAPDTRLPMMYIPDAIRATIELMEAPVENIKTRTSYNLASMSFSPAEIYAEIKKNLPEAQITYQPDFRQEIAASWTESIDDSQARADWGWAPAYDLSAMTKDMIEQIEKLYFQHH
ncbi:NAD-dependent epimerase/dehydratase family protein [Lewinella sp. W8]|uniref:NAD-dependent epimerase/dehydratase family protein n=1 Tax=Lewinella sp. W8 TaxID=2528208 RepID=UPI00106849E8|nr:NAD-dependent epimerase/dehydratase family protein [Lewinella sp. W8]MTB50298.1 NAD-dependent epimerase/dehydratase family protein [Lewinella sp. W8]